MRDPRIFSIAHRRTIFAIFFHVVVVSAGVFYDGTF